MLGSLSYVCGLATAKAWSPSVERRIAGMTRSAENAECRRHDSVLMTGEMAFFR